MARGGALTNVRGVQLLTDSQIRQLQVTLCPGRWGPVGTPESLATLCLGHWGPVGTSESLATAFLGRWGPVGTSESLAIPTDPI